MTNPATLDFAIQTCRGIAPHTAECGCHVALTGGCLYQLGLRKDVDLLFYRIRQCPEINIDLLKEKLVALGFHDIRGSGWLWKATRYGVSFDLFFPEEQGGGYYKEDAPDA